MKDKKFSRADAIQPLTGYYRMIKDVCRVGIYRCCWFESYQAKSNERHLSSGRATDRVYIWKPGNFLAFFAHAREVDRRFFRDADDVPP